MTLAVAHSSTSWGLWAAVAAVIIDSMVTVFVGWKLTKTARTETASAVEKIKPALQTELGNAALILIPLIVAELKKHIDGAKPIDETPRAISDSSHKSTTDTGNVG